MAENFLERFKGNLKKGQMKIVEKITPKTQQMQKDFVKDDSELGAKGIAFSKLLTQLWIINV